MTTNSLAFPLSPTDDPHVAAKKTTSKRSARPANVAGPWDLAASADGPVSAPDAGTKAPRTVATPETEGIGVRLRSARERRDMTAAALAERSGVDAGAISRIETGQRPEIPAATCFRLATALRIRLAWLIAGEGPEDALTYGVDVSALGFMNALGRYEGLMNWLETDGSTTPLFLVAQALAILRSNKRPPLQKKNGTPVGGWRAFFKTLAERPPIGP